MPSIIHNYEVTQEVFHVSETLGVRDAIVKGISIAISQTSVAITYSIAFKKTSQGSALVLENTLYNDVDSALAAYRGSVIVL
ncbi:hypothetical protein M0R04_07485 [Candidatus Dojkabacteria bacterium]|jgi:hypothetical protein|nr:hypothetical protein [Candidatus Dojkabacteria bacterium]